MPFERSILRWDEVGEGGHARMLDWYRQLIELRRSRLLVPDADVAAIHRRFDDARARGNTSPGRPRARLLALQSGKD